VDGVGSCSILVHFYDRRSEILVSISGNTKYFSKSDVAECLDGSRMLIVVMFHAIRTMESFAGCFFKVVESFPYLPMGLSWLTIRICHMQLRRFQCSGRFVAKCVLHADVLAKVGKVNHFF
jgi:hypothetical protein